MWQVIGGTLLDVREGCVFAVELERQAVRRCRRERLSGHGLVMLWGGRYMVSNPQPHGNKPRIIPGFTTRTLGRKNGARHDY